jgi:hypothetical protein
MVCDSFVTATVMTTRSSRLSNPESATVGTGAASTEPLYFAPGSTFARPTSASEDGEGALGFTQRPRYPCIGLKMKILSSVPAAKQVSGSGVS